MPDSKKSFIFLFLIFFMLRIPLDIWDCWVRKVENLE